MEIMHLRNEINRMGVDINQIVKNSNSHMHSESDKIELKLQLEIIKDILEVLVAKLLS